MVGQTFQIACKLPKRDLVRITSDEQVDELLLLLGGSSSKFWKSGSGDVQLSTVGRAQEHSLTVMCRPSVGFILTSTVQPASPGQMYISSHSEKYTDLVSLFTGGDYFNFWKDFFVDEHATSDAIRLFCRKGDRPECIRWIRRLDAPSINDEFLHGEEY